MELIKPDTKIDFMGKRYYAYAFTTIMLLISLFSIPLKGHVRLGVDFSGGAMVQVRFTKPVETDAIREALSSMGENLVVQKLVGVEEFVIRLEVPEHGGEKLSQQVMELLESKIGKGNVEIRSLEMVGPKVGKDLQNAAIWATVVALCLLMIYMAFRFTFTMGLGAIACLIHDIIIVYGFLCVDRQRIQSYNLGGNAHNNWI